MSMLFAATYPERTRALTLYGSYARHPTLTPDIGVPPASYACALNVWDPLKRTVVGPGVTMMLATVGGAAPVT